MSLLAAEGGPVTVVSLILAVSATVAAVGGWVVQRRNAATAASTSYVDRNLAAMQRIIDLQTVEDNRLRALAEERAVRIDALEADNADVHAELVRCRQRCEDCLARVKRLETKEKSS